MSSYLQVLSALCERVQKAMAGKVTEEIEWNVDTEILLFMAMIGHKPVGLNRYFMMASIHNKFSCFINKQITSKPIWQHLDTMYDMAALHESEIIPFPNEEVEFALPGDEFDEIALERLGVKISDVTSSAPTSPTKQPSNSKQPKKVTPSKPKQNTSSASKASNDDAHFRKPLPQTVPISGKLSKNVSADSKSGDKGSGTSSKSDKVKQAKQPESANAEAKSDASNQMVVKKPVKVEKSAHDEKQDKKPRDSPSGAKVAKSSSETTSSKPAASKEEAKVAAKTELVKKESTEGKTSSSTSKPVKKEGNNPPTPSEKSSKETKSDSSSATKGTKRVKTTDSKKSEQAAKRRRT